MVLALVLVLGAQVLVLVLVLGEKSLLTSLDDTKIYFKVNSSENIERLRDDLCKLVFWSKEWQMLFNIEKCTVMHLGYDNPHASCRVLSLSDCKYRLSPLSQT